MSDVKRAPACDRCFISSGCHWKCLRGDDLATIAHLKELLHRAASYGGIEPQLDMEIRAALYTIEDLKRGEILSFDDGQLRIKTSGHGSGDGWGEFTFHERQIELDADGFASINVPPSELIALKDFLNRVICK